MRICVVASSEEVDSQPQQLQGLSNATWHISQSQHEFVTQWVTKENTLTDIETIPCGGFDAFVNCMRGAAWDNVQRAEATRYLQAQGLPVLLDPSQILSKSSKDVQKTAEVSGVLVLPDSPGKYPKTVKYLHGFGPDELEHAYVCASEDEVTKCVELLRGGNVTQEILIQDYVNADDYSVIVIEMGSAVVALTPYRSEFLNHTSSNQDIMARQVNSEAYGAGSVNYTLIQDPTAEKLKLAAIELFKALGASNGGGWARIDLKLEKDTDHIYLINIDPIPSAFERDGGKFGERIVLDRVFPGGVTAAFDMILATKQMQLGGDKDGIRKWTGFFDKFAPTYDTVWKGLKLAEMQREIASQFDFSGSILDMGCGTGAAGRVLNQVGKPNFDITGIDISEGMLREPDIAKYYKQPLRIGPMQELIMVAEEFDHIVCYGAVYFLDPVEFNAVLARMFMLARKSVTFEVDDIDEHYIQYFQSNRELYTANHVKATEQFGIPQGWKLVYKKREWVYTSPTTKQEVYGDYLRYEKQT